MPLNIVVESFYGPMDKREMVDSAVARLNAVVNSDEFRDAVSSHRTFRHNQGLTAPEVYNRIITGDKHGHGDLEASRDVPFVYTIKPGSDGSVIGYRSEYTNKVFTYQDRFDEMGVPELAAHLAHEVVGHLAGEFGHPKFRWRGRGRSVPYVVDDIVEDLLEAGVGL